MVTPKCPYVLVMNSGGSAGEVSLDQITLQPSVSVSNPSEENECLNCNLSRISAWSTPLTASDLKSTERIVHLIRSSKKLQNYILSGLEQQESPGKQPQKSYLRESKGVDTAFIQQQILLAQKETQDVKQAFKSLQVDYKSLQKQMHQVRIKNMTLREDWSKLSQRVKLLERDNLLETEKVAELEKKQAEDCNSILQQLKQIQSLEKAQKLAKKRLTGMQYNLKKASQLFNSTLKVKLEYEQVLASLMKNPRSHEMTLKAIERYQRKSRKEGQESRPRVYSNFTSCDDLESSGGDKRSKSIQKKLSCNKILFSRLTQLSTPAAKRSVSSFKNACQNFQAAFVRRSSLLASSQNEQMTLSQSKLSELEESKNTPTYKMLPHDLMTMV